MRGIIFIILGVSIFLVACSTTPPMNTQLNSIRYEAKKAIDTQNNKALIILTFSGGGVRSAAFSYGVLKGLNTLAITPQKTLLDEVDIISSVSGGSFTAAYYGLFGKRIFKNYKPDFLTRPIKREFLIRWMFSPRSLRRMAHRQFSRSDLLAEYYDEKLYLNKTFADMQPDMPSIIINTTDLSTGQPFAFTTQNMQWICSRLADYSVSRAVMASSAVPGVFSPVALKNYAGCHEDKFMSKNTRADIFRDKKRYPNLHLIDGGISDNLGIRGVLDAKIFQEQLQNAKTKGIQQVVFIVVDAADTISPAIAQQAGRPSFSEAIGAATTIQIQRYNKETFSVLDRQIKKWEKKYNDCGLSKPCKSMHFHKIELNFRKLPRALADKLMLYKTTLELEKKQIDALVAAGEHLLINNKQLISVLRALSNKKKKEYWSIKK